jgi:hypothetical protein
MPRIEERTISMDWGGFGTGRMNLVEWLLVAKSLNKVHSKPFEAPTLGAEGGRKFSVNVVRITYELFGVTSANCRRHSKVIKPTLTACVPKSWNPQAVEGGRNDVMKT